MIGRETFPMPPVTKKESMVIGVIGTERGAGASFVCRLLEREIRAGQGSFLEKEEEDIMILDMGEAKECDDMPPPDRFIVVADGSSLSEDRLKTGLKIMKDHGRLWAVVFNKCSDEFEYPEDLRDMVNDLPCFRIPFIRVERFTELYNFIFYS